MDAEKLIEKLSKEQEESSAVVRVAVQYAQFVQLVQKMREKQLQVEQMDNDTWDEEVYNEMVTLESMVDEHIKLVMAWAWWTNTSGATIAARAGSG